MLLRKETKDIQEALAQFTRTGDEGPVVGARKDRLHHYRRLVFNIQLQTMEQAFPIAHSFIDGEVWKDMVHSFFQNHDAQTPQIWKLPFEFYQYVEQENYASQLNIPFLNDLLLFEWVEIEVHTMAEYDIPKAKALENIEEDKLVINPEYRLNRLSYPVYRVKPSELTEDQKGDYFLLTYREQETGRVQFMELTLLHALVLEKIDIEGKNVRELLEDISTSFQVDDMEEIKKSALIFISQLQERRILLNS